MTYNVFGGTLHLTQCHCGAWAATGFYPGVDKSPPAGSRDGTPVSWSGSGAKPPEADYKFVKIMHK